MSQLRVRSLDEGELDGAEEILGGTTPAPAVARASLARLGGVADESLKLGDGWAASVEVEGTTLIVRGEPVGPQARWTIYGKPNLEAGAHAARRLVSLLGEEAHG